MEHCEAMVKLPRAWTRCGRKNADIHHRITRARGGLLLDAVGETAHLMALCREHHSVAHDEGEAFESGLLLAGYVLRFGDKVIYRGPDEYLSRRYPA